MVTAPEAVSDQLATSIATDETVQDRCGVLAVASTAALRMAGSLRGRLITTTTAPSTKLSSSLTTRNKEREQSSMKSRFPAELVKLQNSWRVVAKLPSDQWSDVLRDIQETGCVLLQIESHPSGLENGCQQDLIVDVLPPLVADPDKEKTIQRLSNLGLKISVNTETTLKTASVHGTGEDLDEAKWFPTRPADLDEVVNRVLQVEEQSIEHPSMQDKNYQTRRKMFAQLAFDYKHDQPIPLVDYTDEENRTWSTVFNRLIELYDQHACKEFLENFKQLRDIGLYRSDRVPQLRDVSDFVRRRSGFTLRPVAGYLSARDFLSALALRVFCCTQYIRHAEKPFYTPEPDCCHELLGHVPMLADPTFAHFSQEIGLASLGASEEDVKKLATCYFFTVEFGFCKEAGEMKVYGAGLLACVDEFVHAVSDRATICEFDPAVVLQQECKVTTFQDMYFYTNSFTEAKEKLRNFAKTLKRRQTLLYNPYTQSVEKAESASSEAVQHLLDRICWDLESAVQVAQEFNL